MKYCPICDTHYEDEVDVCKQDGAKLRRRGVEQDPFVGKVIKGRYHVLKKLGEGGMGTVYLADQVSIGRKIALKVLHGQYARDEEFVRRFRTEARLAASLNHRNIMTVYDFDQADDGSLFIVMEYVEGRNLKEVIQQGPVSVETAVRLGIQIADGLGAAHRAGVIHRDIKPENIMVTGNGDSIKLMDFGIARLRDTGETRLTRSGVIMGTPSYMSPEQVEGAEGADPVTEKTDIYAFGIVLYEMLSGSVPFKASTPSAVLIKQLQEAPTPLRKLRREIPAPLESIVMQALEKKPQKRPHDMREIAAQLQKIDAPAMVDESAKTMVGTMILGTATNEWLDQVRTALSSKALAMISLLLVLGALGYWFFGGVRKEADSSKLISLTLQGERRELRTGEKILLKAAGTLSDGSDVEKLENASWRSSDESVVAVNAKGEAEARKEGFADISVHYQGVTSSALTLMVKNASQPAEPPISARVQEHIKAAQTFRDRGDYSGALTELAKAKALDPKNRTVESDLDHTKKACLAEQRVGLTKSKCD